jgi:hypothetical protein
MGFSLMIVSTPAANYRPQVQLLKSLIERVQEERDRLIQEASDWRDQTQAFELFWKQQQAERDFAEPTAEQCPGHSTFGQ